MVHRSEESAQAKPGRCWRNRMSCPRSPRPSCKLEILTFSYLEASDNLRSLVGVLRALCASPWSRLARRTRTGPWRPAPYWRRRGIDITVGYTVHGTYEW